MIPTESKEQGDGVDYKTLIGAGERTEKCGVFGRTVKKGDRASRFVGGGGGKEIAYRIHDRSGRTDRTSRTASRQTVSHRRSNLTSGWCLFATKERRQTNACVVC